MNSFLFILGLLLCLAVNNHQEAHCCEAFTIPPSKLIKQRRQPSESLPVRKRKKDQDDTILSDQNLKSKKDTTNSYDEKKNKFTLYEISQIEERASRKNMNRLLLLPRIGQAITGLAYAFVIASIVLEIFGYGFIKGADGWITVDTMENISFQKEMMKSSAPGP